MKLVDNTFDVVTVYIMFENHQILEADIYNTRIYSKSIKQKMNNSSMRSFEKWTIIIKVWLCNV